MLEWLIVSGLIMTGVWIALEGIAWWCFGVRVSRAELTQLRRHKRALEDIARMPVTPGPTLAVTEAQYMRALARRSLAGAPAPQLTEDVVATAAALHWSEGGIVTVQQSHPGGGASEQRPPTA